MIRDLATNELQLIFPDVGIVQKHMQSCRCYTPCQKFVEALHDPLLQLSFNKKNKIKKSFWGVCFECYETQNT